MKKGPILLVLLVLIIAAFSWLVSIGGGVMLANEIPEDMSATVRGVLRDGEDLRALAEISLGGMSEYAAITDRRVIYVKDRRVTDIAHADIQSVELRDDIIGGTALIVGKDGSVMKIILANDPHIFVRTLNQQGKRSTP